MIFKSFFEAIFDNLRTIFQRYADNEVALRYMLCIRCERLATSRHDSSHEST